MRARGLAWTVQRFGAMAIGVPRSQRPLGCSANRLTNKYPTHSARYRRKAARQRLRRP